MKRTDYVIKRTLMAVLTVFVVISFDFALFRAMPGNFTDLIRSPHATKTTKEALLREFGLNQPEWKQYVLFLDQLFLHANLGISSYNNQPVWPQLMLCLGRTLLMLLVGTALSILLGVVTGVLGAWRRSTWVEHVNVVTALALYAVPTQWLGIVIIAYLAPRLGLPTTGITNVFATYTGWAHAQDFLAHMILPALTLCLTLYAEYTLIVRSAMLETMGEDFVLTARAKGLPQRTVVRKYALRNAMLPTVTLIALSIGYIVAGAYLIEVVFNYEGIGFQIQQAVENYDYWMLQGGFLLLTVSVIFFNFVADLIYFKLDPRITE